MSRLIALAVVGMLLASGASAQNGVEAPVAAAVTPSPTQCDGPGVVALAGEVILRIHSPAGGKNCQQRADVVTMRIVDALGIGLVYPQDINVQFVRGEWAVFVKDILIITADRSSAKVNKSTPRGLAEVWANNLRRTIPESTPQKPGIGGTPALEPQPK